MAFRRGDYKPFIRASIAAYELLETASAPEIALAVPYLSIKQVDPYTGQIIGENIMKELFAMPILDGQFGGTFAERPLVSLHSVEVKTEQQFGYAYNNIITMEFTVERPNVVFSSDEYSAWRELLVEGNAFLLEYGWTSNPGALKNDLLNGVGFYDESNGLLVQARTSMLISIVKYGVSIQADGKSKFSMEALSMGNLGLRQVSLGNELAMTFVPENNSWGPIRRMKWLISNTDAEIDRAVKKSLQKTVERLEKEKGFTKNKRRYVKLGDILDALVAPVLQNICSRIGYKRVDLFLGNFNKRAGKTSDGYGSIELSSKSIGEFPVPFDELTKLLGNLQIRGKLMRVENFIDALLSLTRGPDRWSGGAFVPNIFPISRDIPDHDNEGIVFFYAIADVFDGSDVFDDDDLDKIPAEIITKEEVLRKLKDRAIPVLEVGKVSSAVKDIQLEINPEPLQRSIFAERQLQARKDQVQITEQPDPRALAGRSNSKTVIPLGIMTGNATLIGNFIFQLFSYVWIEYYGAYPISGIYNVRGRTDKIEPGAFTTILDIMSEGIDPFNTRRRLSSIELNEERRKRDEQRKSQEDRKKKRFQGGGRKKSS